METAPQQFQGPLALLVIIIVYRVPSVTPIHVPPLTVDFGR